MYDLGSCLPPFRPMHYERSNLNNTVSEEKKKNLTRKSNLGLRRKKSITAIESNIYLEKNRTPHIPKSTHPLNTRLSITPSNSKQLQAKKRKEPDIRPLPPPPSLPNLSSPQKQPTNQEKEKYQPNTRSKWFLVLY